MKKNDQEVKIPNFEQEENLLTFLDPFPSNEDFRIMTT